MKHSQLKQLIKEEIRNVLNEKGADTDWTDEEGNKVTLQDILDMTNKIK